MSSSLTTAAIGGGFRQIVRVARYAAVLCASLIITTIAETLNTRDADHVRETQMRFDPVIDIPAARQIEIQQAIDSIKPAVYLPSYEGVGQVKVYEGKAAADRRAAIKQQIVTGKRS
mgnify:CR=1 FL=1